MWITSTKNLAKTHEKTFQNPGPEAPKSSSGGFWVALERFLVTRDLPDASGTPSRRLWGGSWGRFRLILAHLGGVLGAQDGPINFAKTAQDASKMAPRHPKIRFSAKKQGKMSPSSSGGIFFSILVRFNPKNASPNFEKSLKLCWTNNHF